MKNRYSKTVTELLFHFFSGLGGLERMKTLRVRGEHRRYVAEELGSWSWVPGKEGEGSGALGGGMNF